MFGSSNGGASLSDIAALIGNQNGGLGGNNGIWVLIILFALFGGWGNRGNNNNGDGQGASAGSAVQGALTRGDLCMDMNFQNLLEAARSTQDAVNVDFANLNSTICAQQYETTNRINALKNTFLQTANAQNLAYLQNMNALQNLINQCCCDIKSLFAQAEYNRATDTCTITRAIQDAARDIMNNDNANYRQLHDEQIALQMQQKDAQIAALTSALGKCDTKNIVDAAVQSAVSQIRPTADPAYIVPNPYACYQWPFQFSFGQGNCQCGGNNFNVM